MTYTIADHVGTRPALARQSLTTVVGDMARARKPNKWKQMLDEVEEKHRQLEARVAALETERVRYAVAAAAAEGFAGQRWCSLVLVNAQAQLIQRADMLSVVAEGGGWRAQQHH
jgi:hypothetical protein